MESPFVRCFSYAMIKYTFHADCLCDEYLFFFLTKAFTDTAYCVGVYSLIHESRAHETSTRNWLECTGMACARKCFAGCSSHVDSVVDEPSMENGVRAALFKLRKTKYFYVEFLFFAESLLSNQSSSFLHWILFSLGFHRNIRMWGHWVWQIEMWCSSKNDFFFEHFLVRYFSSLFTGVLPFSNVHLMHYQDVVLVNMWMTWIVKVDSFLFYLSIHSFIDDGLMADFFLAIHRVYGLRCVDGAKAIQ